jgi:hypothetical protein
LHAFAPIEASKLVTNGMPLIGCSLHLPVGTVNYVESLKGEDVLDFDFTVDHLAIARCSSLSISQHPLTTMISPSII